MLQIGMIGGKRRHNAASIAMNAEGREKGEEWGGKKGWELRKEDQGKLASKIDSGRGRARKKVDAPIDDWRKKGGP